MAKAKYNDPAHREAKAHWRPIVDTGQVQCHAVKCLMPTRWLTPFAPFDMGHTPDGTAHTGPEHPKCNRSEGAARGNRQRAPKRRTKRAWSL